MQQNPPKSLGLKEFWEELGYSKSTFYRRLGSLGLKTRRRILSPDEQDYFRIKLGFPPKFSHRNGHNPDHYAVVENNDQT